MALQLKINSDGYLEYNFQAGNDYAVTNIIMNSELYICHLILEFQVQSVVNHDIIRLIITYSFIS